MPARSFSKLVLKVLHANANVSASGGVKEGPNKITVVSMEYTVFFIISIFLQSSIEPGLVEAFSLQFRASLSISTPSTSCLPSAA